MEQPAAAAGITLEITGIEGGKTLSMDDILKFPAVEGQAGIKSSTGKITPPALYKGVLLSDLISQVQPLDSSLAVQVVFGVLRGILMRGRVGHGDCSQYKCC